MQWGLGICQIDFGSVTNMVIMEIVYIIWIFLSLFIDPLTDVFIFGTVNR